MRNFWKIYLRQKHFWSWMNVCMRMHIYTLCKNSKKGNQKGIFYKNAKMWFLWHFFVMMITQNSIFPKIPSIWPNWSVFCTIILKRIIKNKMKREWSHNSTIVQVTTCKTCSLRSLSLTIRPYPFISLSFSLFFDLNPSVNQSSPSIQSLNEILGWDKIHNDQNTPKPNYTLYIPSHPTFIKKIWPHNSPQKP